MKIPIKISLKDLVDVATSKGYSLASTPFGAEPGQRQFYIRRAVPWKGVKGIENVEKINSGVARGLRKAIEISRRHHETGKAILVYPDGTEVVVPMKAAAMSVERHGDYGVYIKESIGVSKKPWRVKAIRTAVAGA